MGCSFYNICCILPCKSHCYRGLAFSFAGSQASSFIYEENTLIVRFPLIAALGIYRAHCCLEQDFSTHRHLGFIAADRNAFGRCDGLHRNGELSLDRLGCIGSRGSFIRTCGSFVRLGRYREGDLSSAGLHGGNRRFGCIARNFCNRLAFRILHTPLAAILVSRARLNHGFEGERILRIEIIHISFRDRNFGRSRNGSGHFDRQCSRDCAVIVVRNSKFHGCFAHAIGGDCAIFCHRQNITVVYAPSAAFVFCTGRVDGHSFQLALLILGKFQLSDCRILTLDLDRSIGDLCDYLDFDGFVFFISLKTIIIAVAVV